MSGRNAQVDIDEFTSQLERSLPLLKLRDAAYFSRQQTKLLQRHRKGQPCDRMLAKLAPELQKALDTVSAWNQANIPLSYPEQLPISAEKDRIVDLLQNNQVVILAGETGSGKTTQLPKMCLDAGLGKRGLIVHTQPRRIAARTVASRIAEELQSPLGSVVGYQVRFTDHSDASTRIKLVTDGILLAEIQRDPLLLDYEVIIVDEAHERSLNIDFLLGYLKQLLEKRQDLTVVVTSATIDVERFSKHFSDAPIIEVSGRTYPVELRYRPWSDEAENIQENILSCLNEILHESRGESGDILIFLSGERDIRDLSHAIKKSPIEGVAVLPLYARLSLSEQNKVFQNNRQRKIVLATNVAETSLTVPGIRYVIDTGYARISRYSLRTKVQRLPIEPISQASANQRMGRCGRVSNGICYRLYEEEDFNNRPPFTDPEILRTNLAAVILQMLQMNMGEPEHFPFVDKPDRKLINDGYRLLEELSAVTRSGAVTALGAKLHRLSVDPKFARMLIEAERQKCLSEMLIIVAALTIQDPREWPNEKRPAAEEKHRRFYDENSDFLAYVNLWAYVEQQRQELSQNQLRRLCKKEFLHFMRLKEWRELHHQLKLQCKDLKLKSNPEPAGYDAIHRSLLVGLLSNVARRDEEAQREYIGTRSRKCVVFPGSALRKKKLPWLMAADFIETSQMFAHCVAKIDPAWVVKSASHLVKHHYTEPHYDAKTGSVKAYDKISLWGLVLSEKQRVDYAKIDAKVARDVFIRSALVEGKYRGKGDFFKQNQQLIDEVLHLEAKARRRDILVDDEVLFTFYSARIPAEIVNLKGFEHWRKKSEETQASLLHLTQSDLMVHGAEGISDEQFPEQLRNGDLSFPVRYEFEPTRKNDGVNVFVPVELLHQVDANQLEWLVPGLLHEKCCALIKTLPKQIRKHFVPVPATVDRILARMRVTNRPLSDALAEQLNALSGQTLSAQDFDVSKLEAYYSANIVVLDTSDNTIDQSRDLETLLGRYKNQVQTTIRAVGSDIERTNISRWDFEHLPKTVELPQGRVKVKAYPALVSDNKTFQVDIKLYDSPLDAEVDSRRGICQLALNEITQTVKHARKNILKGKDLGLSMVELGSRNEVVDDVLLASIRRACFDDHLLATRDRSEFLDAVNHGRANFVAITEEYEKLLTLCLPKVVEIRKKIKTSKNALAMAMSYGDILAQLDALFVKGVLFDTPWSWLQHLPRYMDAILLRIEKAPQKANADRAAMAQLKPLLQRHQDRLDKLGKAAYLSNMAWVDYRWSLEELRVSLFAQTLKTAMPVSEKRLNKMWAELS
jgi:ATP-dependent helicase HrpA